MCSSGGNKGLSGLLVFQFWLDAFTFGSSCLCQYLFPYFCIQNVYISKFFANVHLNRDVCNGIMMIWFRHNA